MLLSPNLLNFIAYYFSAAQLNNIVVFHCWPSTYLATFNILMQNEHNFMQYINTQTDQNLDQFPYRQLNHKLPKLGVFLDMKCNKSETILKIASVERIYTHNFHWLLCDLEADLGKVKRLFGAANLSINAEITYASTKFINQTQPETESELETETVSSVESANYILYDLYNRGSHLGGQLNITIDQQIVCNRTNCQRTQYLSDLYKRTRLQQRRSLHGLSLRIASIISTIPLNSTSEEILAFLSTDNKPHIDTFPRLGFHLSLILRDLLDCNYTYSFFDRWSVDELTGGLIGELTNERADMASSPFILTTARLTYTAGGTEISKFRSICMFRATHNSNVKPSVFFEPFEAKVWYIFLGVLCLSGGLLWFTFCVEKKHNMQIDMPYAPSPLTSCLISFGAACIQGSSLTPRSAGGRIAFVALMLTTFLMYNYYTSIVVSTLLGAPARSDITTIQQLADSSLDVAIEPQPFTRSYIETSPRDDVRSLYKKKFESKKHQNSIWLPKEQALLKMRDTPGFVYISEAASAYEFVRRHYLPHQICDINEIPLRPEAYCHSLVHKNLSYRELVKQHEVRLLETGILQKFRNHWTPTKLHCINSNHIVAVGFRYISPAFVMLIFTYCVAVLLLGIEIAWQRCRILQNSIFV